MDPSRQEPYAYSMKAAAEKLQCCEETIRGMIRRGDLVPIYLGRAVRIPRPQLERLCGIEPSQRGDKTGMMH